MWVLRLALPTIYIAIHAKHDPVDVIETIGKLFMMKSKVSGDDHLTLRTMVRAIIGSRHVRDTSKKIKVSILDRLKHALPTDSASILILTSYYGFHTSLYARSDYKLKKHRVMGKTIDSKNIDTELTWITQDPMTQVSSTIYPTPVSDVRQWYRMSPLMKDHPCLIADE